MKLNKDLIEKVNERIDKIQREATEKIQSEQAVVLSVIASDFSEIGWTGWSKAGHQTQGQYERLQKALLDKKLELMAFDPVTNTGKVKGSSVYNVSGSDCDCSDFAHRGLPCKHIYFLYLHILKNKPRA